MKALEAQGSKSARIAHSDEHVKKRITSACGGFSQIFTDLHGSAAAKRTSAQAQPTLKSFCEEKYESKVIKASLAISSISVNGDKM